MLSFGIEYDFAFSIAAASVALLAGSPPPSFAATMIARVSFEKSFPRFASAAPFLCLIVDHLLCPDTHRLPYLVQEELVDPRVVGQLGVERRHENPALPCEHRMPVDRREHLDVRPGVLDPRRTDEDPAHGLLPVTDVEVRLERAHLPPERIALGREVRQPEVVAIEHDHPRARPEDRALERAKRFVEPVPAHQAADRRRLAAGHDEPVEPLELLRQTYLDRLGAETPEHGSVLAKVPLHGQDADPKRLHEGDCSERYAADLCRASARPSATRRNPVNA